MALLLGTACAHPYGYSPRNDGLHADCASNSDCRVGQCYRWKERAWPYKDRTSCEISCDFEKHDCPGDLTCDAPYPDGPPPFCH